MEIPTEANGGYQQQSRPFAVSAGNSIFGPAEDCRRLTQLNDVARTDPDGQPDKYIFLWIYRDEDDSPYIIRNPPDNLGELLTEWHKLDYRMTKYQDDSEWEYVNVWLKDRGVDIFESSEDVLLDDHNTGSYDDVDDEYELENEE